ncbi:sigma-70 family RNA polymerase sigma factor [Microbacterium paludicola]|uniref:Sigma-70 family RNA polymerase sigma factor n=1 Tax=Microbacterium paludicola TaxID=300019 RepID=A0A4Y9FSC0_9MICO|nr:sigma-70 family RNA polymerase sigma factor [Microbacterium paludicola]MBF0817135.1 sigma-70 family RNA polymerase sigma factor [Microbacterium paludicola]TFU32129.1 sigma-70 family RNA polymerase sigma factor [Microbacterium paludicola]
MEKFATFFRVNYSLVVGVAERRLDSKQDAEEIATEAFHIAWQRYQAGEQLSVPWLYGVVRNLIGDEYRSRGRRAELQRQLNEEFALRIPVSDDLYADVRDAVERLPQMHREVLKMTYWERLTSKEIAAALDMNSAAVRARLMRARRMLRAALNELQGRTGEEVRARG